MAAKCKTKKYADGGKVMSNKATATKPMPAAKPMPKAAPKATIPSDIADQLQTMKNQKAYEDYTKNRKFAKGGMVKGASKGKLSKDEGVKMREELDEDMKENMLKDAGLKSMGYKKGGMVKTAAKSKAKPKGYMCGGKVKK